MFFDYFFDLSLEGKYLVLFILGSCLGAWINWFVDAFGWRPKYRSPWRRFPGEYRQRLKKTWCDSIPILGWFMMSRFVKILFPPEMKDQKVKRRKKFPPSLIQERERSDILPGCETRWFWIRPLMIEGACGFFPIFLYYWEVVCRGMELNVFRFPLIQQIFIVPDLPDQALTILFLIHLLFFYLMLTASLIDLDDYIIPDALTLPGTVIGLILSALFPFMISVPLCWFYRTGPEMPLKETGSFSEYWESMGLGFSFFPLLVMIVFWMFWCFAILDRRWYRQLGVKRAILLCFRRIRQSRLSWIIAILFPLGIISILFCSLIDLQYCMEGGWQRSLSDPNAVFPISCRDGLFNALIGMMVGMILIWTVRIVGRWTLGRESMGFGDVMLMGMLGIYIGWQGTIVVFFLAPFAGVVFGIIRILAGMEKEIPYGPFLCLAAGIWMLGRKTFWSFLEPFLGDPVVVAFMFAICTVLLAAMLYLWRLIKNAFIERKSRPEAEGDRD